MNLPFFLVSRFVAGETRAQALNVAKEIAAENFQVAMDRLGEHETNKEKAVAATDHYINLLHTIGELPEPLSTNIELSIKLSMMGQIIDPSLCRENLRRLLHETRRKDVFVQVDMEGSDLTQSTLDLFEDAYHDYPGHVEPVLQAAIEANVAGCRAHV